MALGVVDAARTAREVDVAPIPMADYNAWAGPYGLHIPADPDVPYLSRMDEPLWWSRLDDAATLFVQYNRVDFLGTGLPKDLMAAAGAPRSSGS